MATMTRTTVTQTMEAPSDLKLEAQITKGVSMKELREAIPAHCFQPSLFWSTLYLLRDLAYSAALLAGFFYLLDTELVKGSSLAYYAVVNAYAFAQGLVFTGLWVIAHDCGHMSFSPWQTLNDAVGFVLHSALLAPYFSWQSTHRRHHNYANHMTKDLNYVPPVRSEYAAKLGVALEMVEEVGQDAPVVLVLRILLQQLIGWNWYILSNITSAPTAVIKPGMSAWRHSHFDPWGAMFHDWEVKAVLLSDLGCAATIAGVYFLTKALGSFETVFWMYIAPWSWLNHWIVMITYLHHTHPKVPKYTAESWTFIRGACATIDRDFGIIGRHLMHHISSDHVTHHLFSRIPHYYIPLASKAIVPLLGDHYHGRGTFTWEDLKVAFRDCQWVERDAEKDQVLGLPKMAGEEERKKHEALWYRPGRSPPVEFMRRPIVAKEEGEE